MRPHETRLIYSSGLIPLTSSTDSLQFSSSEVQICLVVSTSGHIMCLLPGIPTWIPESLPLLCNLASSYSSVRVWLKITSKSKSFVTSKLMHRSLLRSLHFNHSWCHTVPVCFPYCTGGTTSSLALHLFCPSLSWCLIQDCRIVSCGLDFFVAASLRRQ